MFSEENFLGRRKGIGIGGGVSENNEPLYVVRIDPAKGQVIVGPKEALARDIITIEDCNWLLTSSVILSDSEGSSGQQPDPSAQAPQDDSFSTPISVKFRSIMPPVPGKLVIKADKTTEIHLDSPQYGISPGQAAVCYDGDRVLGGGWITKTDNKNNG